jgi:hypothetical protein
MTVESAPCGHCHYENFVLLLPPSLYSLRNSRSKDVAYVLLFAFVVSAAVSLIGLLFKESKIKWSYGAAVLAIFAAAIILRNSATSPFAAGPGFLGGLGGNDVYSVVVG